MDWIIPKTNWTANDYFNYDDALRINNNLAVIKNMAIELFNYISLVTYFRIQQLPGETEKFWYYYVFDINPKNIYVPAVNKGEYDLKYIFTRWETILAKFSFLSSRKAYRIEPDLINIPTYYDYISYPKPYNTPAEYYNGYAFTNDYTTYDALNTGEKIKYFVYNCGAFIDKSYIDYYISGGNYRMYEITPSDGFNNASFYTYNNLNRIENSILNIHSSFERYLEGE